ncbi:MAG: DNA polymerase Y family protein [Chloroflexota bacterium]
MRIACIYMPRFAIQVEQREDPALAGRPLILGNYRRDTGQVYDVSEEAEAHGVVPGMPLRQAYSLCSDGVFRPYNEEKCSLALTGIVALLGKLCPLVEAAPPDHALLGLRYETDAIKFVGGTLAAVQDEGFRASSGIASSRFVAAVAAGEAEPGSVLVVPEGEEQRFLRGLPLEYLPVSDNSVRRLHLFGISTIGEMLVLPQGAIEAQFGAEGRMLLDLARGADTAQVEQWRDDSDFTRVRSFEIPAGAREELEEAVDDALTAICCELEKRWQCCRTLTLSLRLEGGVVERAVMCFKEPVSSLPVMKGRLMTSLDETRLPAPVEELRLEVSGLCAESGKQASFLEGNRRSNGQLRNAVRLLQQRYGRDIVKRVVTRKAGRVPEGQFTFAACDGERV